MSKKLTSAELKRGAFMNNSGGGDGGRGGGGAVNLRRKPKSRSSPHTSPAPTTTKRNWLKTLSTHAFPVAVGLTGVAAVFVLLFLFMKKVKKDMEPLHELQSDVNAIKEVLRVTPLSHQHYAPTTNPSAESKQPPPAHSLQPSAVEEEEMRTDADVTVGEIKEEPSS